MANRFTENMNKEIKANEQAAVEAKAKEIKKANKKLIEDTKPNTIIETMEDVKNGDYHMVKTEDGRPVDVAGNCVSKIVNINGCSCYVCGSTPEELKEDADFIRLALARGDVNLPSFGFFKLSGRYVTQVVNIGGIPTLTVGHTEEERAEDETRARICYAKLRKGSRMDVLTAEELIEAGLKPTKEFEKDGYRYIYFADQKCARTFEGEKVADISDIKDKLSTDTAIELLKARIETPCYDEEDDYDDYDDDDSYDDYEDYDCDGDCDNCENRNCEW